MKYIWVFVKSISQYIHLISLTQAYSVSSFWLIGFRQWWDWEVVYHTQMKSLRIASVYCILKPHVCPNCCCSTISHLNVLVWNLTGQKYQDEWGAATCACAIQTLLSMYLCGCLLLHMPGQAGLMCTEAATANDHCTAAGCSYPAIPQQQIQTLVRTMQTGDCFYRMQKRLQFEWNIYLHVF